MWGLHPETGAVDQLMAMEHLIPPGQKKVAKVYTAACHPLLPHLVAIAANSGQPLRVEPNTRVHVVVVTPQIDNLSNLNGHHPHLCRGRISVL